MLFVSTIYTYKQYVIRYNDANCSSYTHHIKELFCSPKEKDLTLPLNLTLMTVIIYTGNKVKSSRGKKRLQLNFSLLVSKQYP